MNNDNDNTYVKVFESMDSIEAFLFRDRLIQIGIEAEVRGFDRLSALGDMPAGSWPNVWVPKVNEVQALEAAQQFMALPREGKPWTCPACSDENPAEFASCWKCGSDAPWLESATDKNQ